MLVNAINTTITTSATETSQSQSKNEKYNGKKIMDFYSSDVTTDKIGSVSQSHRIKS